MKTMNYLYRTLLMAVAMVMGVVNVNAQLWSINFDGKATGDDITLTVSDEVTTIGNVSFGTASWGGGEYTDHFVWRSQSNESVNTNISATYEDFVANGAKEDEKLRIYATITDSNNWGMYVQSTWWNSIQFKDWPGDGDGKTINQGHYSIYDAVSHCFELTFGSNTLENIRVQGFNVINWGLNISGISIYSNGGSELDNKFVLQTGTSWLLRTQANGDGLYSYNSGARAFGLRDCTAGQVITINATADPTPTTNVRLKSQDGNNYKYVVLEDGGVSFTPPRYTYIHSIVITAGYTVTFKADDEVTAVDYYEPGETIVAKENPTKTGYTFSGWSNYPENMVMPAWNVTVTGSFNVNHHQIQYNVDGNYYDGKYNIPYGATLSPDYIPSNPTKTGYIFDHWEGLPETMPDEDLVVNAVFVADENYETPQYTLTYYLDNEVYRTYELAEGEAITPEANPQREGYTFSGWSQIPATMPAQNTNVYGSFQVNKYKLYYVVDGQVVETLELDYNATIYPKQEPTKDGYVFSGWSEIPATMPAYDIYVNGTFLSLTGSMWKASSSTSTSANTSLIDNSDELLEVNTVYATTLKADSKTLAGEEFTHYIQIRTNSAPTADQPTGTEQSGSTPLVFTPKKNVQVTFYYRRQSDNSSDGIYTSNSGKDLKIVDQSNPSVPIEGVETLLEGSSNSYGFVTKTLCLEAGKTYTLYATGTTVNLYGFGYAPITAMKYILTFNLEDGSTYRTFQLEEGAAIPQVDAPTKIGYTFSGWTPALPQAMPGSHLTVTAQYTANVYNLTFKLNSEDYYVTQLAYGATITAPATPEVPEGYTFSGWIDVPSTMPAQDLIIYGHFTKERTYATLSVGEAGFNTYCTTQPLYFQGSEAIKAYIAKSKSANEVLLTQVIGTVAAGTGLVLKGDNANATAQIEVVASGTSYPENLLVGVTGSNAMINAANLYVLVVKGNTVKFADTENHEASVPVGKAYLEVPNSSRMLTVVFDDETTSVLPLAVETETDNAIYNLRGQRVQNPKKGLYIVNGKKVIIK